MIYEGKEYKEVADGSARIGDLIHVTEVESEVCDIWCFTTDLCIKLPNLDVILPNGWETLDEDADVFTRYRYVKDVEENSSFSVGDTVKIVGTSFAGFDAHIGNTAGVVEVYTDGDVRVSINVGENNYVDGVYSPSSLELIENPTQPITEELSEKVESNAITLDKATRDKLNEVAKGKSATKKIAVFAVMEYSFSHQGLVNKKEVDRHKSLDRAIAVSEGLNERNRKCFYSVDGILV